MKAKKIICASMLGLTLASCTSLGNKTTGAASGAAAGALLGQIIGQNTKGTLIGAGIGALAGIGWGAYRDYQEQELREKLKNTDIQISKEGDSLNLYLPSGVTFATNSSDIASSFYRPLNSIANVLVKYPESRVVVSGYTDNTGSPQYNLELSQKRANSVYDYLVSQGVAANRMTAVGYGINNPRATNSTPEGRAENRRVEIKILPLNQ